MPLDSPPQYVRAVLERRGLPGGRFVRLWGGMGSAFLCEACQRLIGPEEVEFECEFRHGSQSLTLRLHRKCWENWHVDDAAP